MNLLNLIENATAGYDNLRALMQATQSGQDAVLNVGGETVTLDPMETRWMFGKYKAFNKAGRQEEFLSHLADPVKFDQHMRQLRQMMDKQKNFRGSVPGQRDVQGDTYSGQVEEAEHSDQSKKVFKDKSGNPVGEIGIDPESSPGNGEWYVHHYATGYSVVGFDSPAEAKRELMYVHKHPEAVEGHPSTVNEQGMAEDESAVEEIAMQDPNNMSPQTRGKLNWENMIKDYMDNKPYTEFEFGGDRPLTLYRTQIYAILKAFGNMKPQNKINIILNTFGDKMATVEYLDKLRAKGMMPKKVPAYVPPGTEPVPPGQMSLPGMDAPKIREADNQKKNPKATDLDSAVNPRVARAMQLARARQSAAGNDTEAMVADFVDQQDKDQAEFTQVNSVNRRQDKLLKQITAVNQQQDQEINSLDSDNTDLQNNLQQLQAVNADLAKKLADVSQRRADRQPEPQSPAQSTRTPAQPTATAEPLPQPATVSQTAPTKKKKATTRKKSSATKVQRPQQDISPAQAADNVLQFPQGGRRGQAPDELAAALQGVDMGNEPGTGTYGLRENSDPLNIGDPVIISGNVEFAGKTGDVAGFGRDKHFVIVDLYNFGKHAFHASNVQYNDYADQEDYADEDQVDEMQTKLDRYNVNQPPAGGTNKQREKFLDLRDRLFRQMQSATPGEKEAIRLKIAELEGRAQSLGIKIRETGEFNRAGHNAIRDVSDWQEKMRVMQELQKDQELMSDPESRAAIEQRIGDLLKVKPQGVAESATAPIIVPKRRAKEKKPTKFHIPHSASDYVPPALAMASAEALDRIIADPSTKETTRELAKKARAQKKKGVAEADETSWTANSAQFRKEEDMSWPVEVTLEPNADINQGRGRQVKTMTVTGQSRDAAKKKLVDYYRKNGWTVTGIKFTGDLDEQDVAEEKSRDYLKPQWPDQRALPKAVAKLLLQYAKQNKKSINRLIKASPFDLIDVIVEVNPEFAEDNLEHLSDNDFNWVFLKATEMIAKSIQQQGVAEGDVIPFKRPESKIKPEVRRVFIRHLLDQGYTNDEISRMNDEQFTKAYYGIKGKKKVKDVRPNWTDDLPDELDEQGVAEARRVKGGDYQLKLVDQQSDDNTDLDDVVMDYYFDVYQNGQKIGTAEGDSYYGELVVKPEFDRQFKLSSFHDKDHPLMQQFEKIENGVAESETDYSKRRQREKDVDAGKPVAKQRQSKMTDYQKKRAQDRKEMELGEQQMCPECGGPSFSDLILAEKQDACYNKVKSRYKVWPSAYASGALVQCRKKGAANWGNKKK